MRITTKGVLLTIAVVLCILCTDLNLHCQEKTYVPTEVEKLKLENLQKDAIILQQAVQLAQQQLDKLQQQAREAYSALTVEGNKVKADHKWPTTVVFSPQTLEYMDKPHVTIKEVK